MSSRPHPGAWRAHVTSLALRTWVDAATRAGDLRRKLADQAGEGVISTAIAVLVMAFLGAAMWVTFNAVWKDTSANTEEQVKIIGTDADAPAVAP